MKTFIDIGHTETYPTVGANASSDGEVILTFNCYPHSSMMTVPMSVAVELATKILVLANKELKEAA